MTSFELEEHHRRILTTACEAWDRMVQAREMLAKDGIVTTNRHGELRPHPALAVERDCRIAFLRALRELALDVQGPDEAPRPPSFA